LLSIDKCMLSLRLLLCTGHILPLHNIVLSYKIRQDTQCL
jgi:hypothetical protein